MVNEWRVASHPLTRPWLVPTFELISAGAHQLDYGDSLHRRSDLLGIEFQFARIGKYAMISISQIEYGRYWVTAFEELVAKPLKIYAAAGCAIHIGKPGDADPPGQYKNDAPKFVTAAMYAARMSQLGLLFPCMALSRRFDPWTFDDDRRLVVMYGRWKGLVYEEDPMRLRLRVHPDDTKQGYVFAGACDSDHAACPHSRRSTSGSDSLVTGKNGTLALLDA